jgi:hypothetical protein
VELPVRARRILLRKKESELSGKRTFFLYILVLGLTTTLAGQESTFVERLNQNRYELKVQDGRLVGSGVPILTSAVKDAQFVMIGEDHGIAQIPAIYGGVCDLVGPEGFHTMAIEAGPLVAARLEQWVRHADGQRELTAFEQKYPASIAFYDWAEEFGLLAHCAGKATGGQFRLWGLDQELMGSTGLILDEILAQKPGPEAAQEARLLLQKNQAAQAAAMKSGNPGELYMLSASDDDLNRLGGLLAREGNPRAQALFSALMESREIYRKNMSRNYDDSNRQRALLATKADARAPKVLFKFGAWHMFKGFNPLHNNDMGNFVMELADGQGTKSVHIAILGVKGSQLRFAGVGKPYQASPLNLAEDKDSDFLYLKPMFDNLLTEGFTLFDLRGLRKNFKSLGTVDREMERLIYGYDFLVLVPTPTPSKAIE